MIVPINKNKMPNAAQLKAVAKRMFSKILYIE